MSALEPRYATALLDVAQSSQQSEVIGTSLHDFAKAMKDSKELSIFMLNPTVPQLAKKDVLKQILPDNAPMFAVNFLNLLVDKGRLVNLHGILDEYDNKIAKQDGVLTIEVTSALPLSQQQIDEISATYCKKHNAQKSRVITAVDPSLLGGIRVQIGDILTDDTIYGRLRGLASAIG